VTVASPTTGRGCRAATGQGFEKFYRGIPGGRGAGLGLAISQGIVRRTAGNIWAARIAEGGVAVSVHAAARRQAAASVPADA